MARGPDPQPVAWQCARRSGAGACDGRSRGAPHGARGDAGVRAGRRRSAGWRPGMTAEFPLIVTLADAAQGRAISVEADAGARAAIARRPGLVALDRFVLTADVRAIAGGTGARGEGSGDVVQACAGTDLPGPSPVDAPSARRQIRKAAGR